MPVPRCPPQRRPPAIGLPVHVHLAGLEQLLHDRLVPVPLILHPHLFSKTLYICSLKDTELNDFNSIELDLLDITGKTRHPRRLTESDRKLKPEFVLLKTSPLAMLPYNQPNP